MRSILKNSSILLIGLIFITLPIMGLAATPSTAWALSEGDQYYIRWTKHPTLNPTTENPIFERVTVTYNGSAYAVHAPTAWFLHSINMSGEVFKNGKYIDLQGSSQIALYNGTSYSWFCGGLFSGAPVIAPRTISQAERRQTNVINSDLLWLGAITVDDSTEGTYTRWTYTNGTNILKVQYDDDGFLLYYYLKSAEKEWEATMTYDEPDDAPEESVGGSLDSFNLIGLLIFSIIGIGGIISFKIKKNSVN